MGCFGTGGAYRIGTATEYSQVVIPNRTLWYPGDKEETKNALSGSESLSDVGCEQLHQDHAKGEDLLTKLYS